MKRIALLVIIAAAVLLAPTDASAQCFYVCSPFNGQCEPNTEPVNSLCIQEIGWCWMHHDYYWCHGTSRTRGEGTMNQPLPKWRIASIQIERPGLPAIRVDTASMLASIEVKPNPTLR